MPTGQCRVGSHEQADKYFTRSPETPKPSFPLPAVRFLGKNVSQHWITVGQPTEQNPCWGLAVTMISHLWLLLFWASTNSHTLFWWETMSHTSHSSQSPLFFYLATGEFSPLTTAVIPQTHNFPLAKIAQVGWVWGQQPPGGLPNRQATYPKYRYPWSAHFHSLTDTYWLIPLQ